MPICDHCGFQSGEVFAYVKVAGVFRTLCAMCYPKTERPMTLGEARQKALAIVDEVYARRAEAAERDPDQAACPECAEKDAEIERLKAQVASGLPTLTSSAMADQLAAIAKKGGA